MRQEGLGCNLSLLTGRLWAPTGAQKSPHQDNRQLRGYLARLIEAAGRLTVFVQLEAE